MKRNKLDFNCIVLFLISDHQNHSFVFLLKLSNEFVTITFLKVSRFQFKVKLIIGYERFVDDLIWDDS